MVRTLPSPSLLGLHGNEMSFIPLALFPYLCICLLICKVSGESARGLLISFLKVSFKELIHICVLRYSIQTAACFPWIYLYCYLLCFGLWHVEIMAPLLGMDCKGSNMKKTEPRKQTVSIPTPGLGLRNTVLEWDGRRMVWSVHSWGKCVLEQKLTLWFPLSFSGNRKVSKNICRRFRVTFSFSLQAGTPLRLNGSIINNYARATGINHVTLILDDFHAIKYLSMLVCSF